MSERSYLNMEGGDLLAALGDDASKWAGAFCEIASSKGLTIDEGWMLAWFANAIEHSSDVRRRRILPPGSDTSPAAPAADAMERALEVVDKFLSPHAHQGFKDELQRIAFAAITSAVEQERQACALLIENESRFRPDRIPPSRFALAAMIRSRSAGPPDAEGGESGR